jgi:hypothetical protein
MCGTHQCYSAFAMSRGKCDLLMHSYLRTLNCPLPAHPHARALLTRICTRSAPRVHNGCGTTRGSRVLVEKATELGVQLLQVCACVCVCMCVCARARACRDRERRSRRRRSRPSPYRSPSCSTCVCAWTADMRAPTHTVVLFLLRCFYEQPVETERTDGRGLKTAASSAAVHWCLDAVEQVLFASQAFFCEWRGPCVSHLSLICALKVAP